MDWPPIPVKKSANVPDRMTPVQQAARLLPRQGRAAKALVRRFEEEERRAKPHEAERGRRGPRIDDPDLLRRLGDAIDGAMLRLSGEGVADIRYSIETDVAGEEAVFAWIVIDDTRVPQTDWSAPFLERMAAILRGELGAREIDLWCYVRFVPLADEASVGTDNAGITPPEVPGTK